MVHEKLRAQLADVESAPVPTNVERTTDSSSGSLSAENWWRSSVCTCDVLGVRVAQLHGGQFLEAVGEHLEKGSRGWVCYVNIHAINLAFDYPWFRAFLNTSLLTYCDGMGVRLGAWLLGHDIPERITLTDYVVDIFDLCAAKGKSVFLLGSSSATVGRALAQVRRHHPSLKIVGCHHGYFPHNDGTDVVRSINRARPDLLVVGMGMPAQEGWIIRNFHRLDVGMILPAGGTFEFISGTKRRCPRWMGEYGLEWMFRLMLEPRRLWRRYLIGNPLFLKRILQRRRVVKDSLRNLFHRDSRDDSASPCRHSARQSNLTPRN